MHGYGCICFPWLLSLRKNAVELGQKPIGCACIRLWVRGAPRRGSVSHVYVVGIRFYITTESYDAFVHRWRRKPVGGPDQMNGKIYCFITNNKTKAEKINHLCFLFVVLAPEQSPAWNVEVQCTTYIRTRFFFYFHLLFSRLMHKHTRWSADGDWSALNLARICFCCAVEVFFFLPARKPYLQIGEGVQSGYVFFYSHNMFQLL